MIGNGFFSPENADLYTPIIEMLLNQGDHFMVLADYAAYIDCQEKVSELYKNKTEWTKKSILNVANMGLFSSDRTIAEYAEEIWNIKPVNIELNN